MKTYTFTVEGIDILVTPSKHAVKRMIQRDINGYQIAGALMMIGEKLLDMKSGHEFIIRDEDLNASYAFAIHADLSGDIHIDIITVLNSKDIWNKRGTEVLQII